MGIAEVRAKLNEALALLDAMETPSYDYSVNFASLSDLSAFMASTGYAGTYSLDNGLSMAGARTNKLFPSNDFVMWSKSGATVVSENGWQKITETATNSSHEVFKAIPANSGKHTLSLTAKAGTCSKFRLWLTQAANGYYAEVDLAAGTITPAIAWGTGTPLGSSITPLGNGEYRVTVSGIQGGGYFDIAMMSGNAWQYLGTSRTLFVKECQFEAGDTTAYIPTTTAPVSTPSTRLERNVPAPESVLKRMKIVTSPAGGDYEVFYHFDNNENNANYADTELFRYGNNLHVRTTHLNTVIQEVITPCQNNSVYVVAWHTSANGLYVSINGSAVVSRPGDTFKPMTRERLNGNLTGDRVANGKLLEDSTTFNVPLPNLQELSV